jgi:hypothetical protein
MKDARNSTNGQSKQGHVNTPRPDIRDNLDSRENLELNDDGKGHNKKATHQGDDAKNEQNDKRGSRP